MDALVIAGAVRMGKRKAVDVVQGALDRAESNAHLGAFTVLHSQQALQRAAAIDAAVEAGTDPGAWRAFP